jgi:hypothetical protein
MQRATTIRLGTLLGHTIEYPLLGFCVILVESAIFLMVSVGIKVIVQYTTLFWKWVFI